jgi:hypothetical protein
MVKLMKRILWLKYIPAILATICFAAVTPVQAAQAEPIYIAQSAANYK